MICQLLNSLFVLCFEPVFLQELCFHSAVSLAAFPEVSSFNYNVLKLEICISSHQDHLPFTLWIPMLVDLYFQVTMQCSLLFMPSARWGGKWPWLPSTTHITWCLFSSCKWLIIFHTLLWCFLKCLEMWIWTSLFCSIPAWKNAAPTQNCVTFHDLCRGEGDWIDPG